MPDHIYVCAIHVLRSGPQMLVGSKIRGVLYKIRDFAAECSTRKDRARGAYDLSEHSTRPSPMHVAGVERLRAALIAMLRAMCCELCTESWCLVLA